MLFFMNMASLYYTLLICGFFSQFINCWSINSVEKEKPREIFEDAKANLHWNLSKNQTINNLKNSTERDSHETAASRRHFHFGYPRDDSRALNHHQGNAFSSPLEFQPDYLPAYEFSHLPPNRPRSSSVTPSSDIYQGDSESFRPLPTGPVVQNDFEVKRPQTYYADEPKEPIHNDVRPSPSEYLNGEHHDFHNQNHLPPMMDTLPVYGERQSGFYLHQRHPPHDDRHPNHFELYTKTTPSVLAERPHTTPISHHDHLHYLVISDPHKQPIERPGVDVHGPFSSYNYGPRFSYMNSSQAHTSSGNVTSKYVIIYRLNAPGIHPLATEEHLTSVPLPSMVALEQLDSYKREINFIKRQLMHMRRLLEESENIRSSSKRNLNSKMNIDWQREEHSAPSHVMKEEEIFVRKRPPTADNPYLMHTEKRKSWKENERTTTHRVGSASLNEKLLILLSRSSPKKRKHLDKELRRELVYGYDDHLHHGLITSPLPPPPPPPPPPPTLAPSIHITRAPKVHGLDFMKRKIRSASRSALVFST